MSEIFELGYALFIPPLVDEGDRDRCPQIHLPKLIEPILGNMVPSDDDLRDAHAPGPRRVPPGLDIVLDELPEDLHTDVERDREWNIVQNAETRREVRKLSLVDYGGAATVGDRQLAFFEPVPKVKPRVRKTGLVGR